MNTKHFKALAASMRRSKPSAEQIMLLQAEINQWKIDCQAIASVCGAMNPKFQYHTFMDACGYND